MESATRGGDAEESIGKRYNHTIIKLEELIKNARIYNDKLSKQLYVVNNRSTNVALKMGFSTFEELEETVFDGPEIWNVDSIKANYQRSLETRNNMTRAQADRCNSAASRRLREELEELKQKMSMLQQDVHPSRVDINGVESPRRSISGRSTLSPLKSASNSVLIDGPVLRAELQILSSKYDALVAAKENAEMRYKEDYKKWKQFKSWLFNESKHGEALRAQLAKENLDFGVKYENTPEPRRLISSPSRWHSSPTRSNHDREITFHRMAPNRPACEAMVKTMRSPKPSSDAQFVRAENDALGTLAVLSEPICAEEFRKEPHSEVHDELNPELCGDTSAIKKEVLSCPQSPVASNKGKGRYVEPSGTVEGINALFQINPARNEGLPFQFDEVVRGRAHRQELEVGDCECCKEYYDAIEPLPTRLAPPAWDSVAVADASRHHGQLRFVETESRKKQISRHRHRWSPAKTPPDYWNIGFPTTQEVADINRRAADMHAQKRSRIEKEANTSGGRYVRRQGNM